MGKAEEQLSLGSQTLKALCVGWFVVIWLITNLLVMQQNHSISVTDVIEF